LSLYLCACPLRLDWGGWFPKLDSVTKERGVYPEIPGHEGYFLYSDGVIAFWDRLKNKQVPSATFLREDDVMMVVMRDPDDDRLSRAYPLGHMILNAMAVARGKPLPTGEQRPLFLDGNHLNFSLSNLSATVKQTDETLARNGSVIAPVTFGRRTPVKPGLVQCPYCAMRPKKENLQAHLEKRHISRLAAASVG